jgi:PST family polysaccharide transporter
MNLRAHLAKPINFVKKKLKNDFLRNMGWMTIAELINRVFRLATTVILARFLSKYDYGLAALVLTTYEFTLVFTRFGISAKVIQSDEESLESLCNGAYWLNWVVCFGLFIIQCIAAFPVAWFYRDDQLIWPICLLGLTYLVTPLGRIQATLIQRENRIKITAIINVLQLATANILTAIFAVLHMGMWAIILPRLLVTPIEVFVCLAKHPWRQTKGFTTERWGELFRFGTTMLGSSLLATLRNNLDYLIVGRFLGVQELGIYYFAFNAGLGISLSIFNSLTISLYPYLCAARTNLTEFKKRYFGSLKTISTIIFPFALFQSALAPFYVPIIFGREWIPAIPILILICLSGIPRPFSIAASHLLTAIDKNRLVLNMSVILTIVFTISLLIGVRWQALGVAIAVLVSNMLVMPAYTIWATRYVFGSKQGEPSPP